MIQPIVKHIDGNIINNHISNLKWEPIYRSVSKNQLSDEIVEEVVKMHLSGNPRYLIKKYIIDDVEKKYGVKISNSTLRYILTGQSYTHVTKNFDIQKIDAKPKRVFSTSLLVQLSNYDIDEAIRYESCMENVEPHKRKSFFDARTDMMKRINPGSVTISMNSKQDIIGNTEYYFSDDEFSLRIK